MVAKSKLGEANAFWKYGSKIYEDPWVQAIADIDDGDDAALIDLLLSDEPISKENRRHLANLFQRKKLKHKGTPQTPSYAVSFADDVMFTAVAAVNALVKADTPLADALEQISASHHIDIEMLAAAQSGKLGSHRRAVQKKR